MEIFEIALRAFLSALVLFVLTKAMGKKQISQLNFFDYVLGITIGSIAAEMAIEEDLPFSYPIVAMAIYALCEILISFISEKSLKARHIFTGKPLIIISKGKIIEKSLKKSRLDLNEFLAQVRTLGYFDLSNVYYAILETNGSLSIIPRSSTRPVSVSDMKLTVKQDELCANLILDGKIMKDNLKDYGKNEQWLMKKLEEKNISDVSSVLLAIADTEGTLTVYEKNIPGPQTGVIE